MSKCISCGKEIPTQNRNCPYCGYRFTADENYYCPNKEGFKCAITDNPCNKGYYFSTCEIKNKADREAPF